MRIDKRKPDQLRSVNVNTGFSAFAEGSALFEIGNTKILCNVSIEESVPSWMDDDKKSGGWITAEYAMLPRSTITRKPREIYHLGGRTQEIKRLIGRSLRAGVNLGALGSRTLICDCDVIQADGGTRTAAITGAYIALEIALHGLIEKKIISPQVISKQIAAVSVGIVDGIPMLDLCYEEDKKAEVDANIVMDSVGNYIEIQSTAEKKSFSQQQIIEILKLAEKGIFELLQIQRAILNENSS